MNNTIEELYIVLLEPSQTQRNIIVKQFKELGVTNFECVASANEALDIARNTMPDLVISAMHLPDMTCTEMLAVMRQDSVLRDMRVMLISTETAFEVLDPVKQAGATALLPKPFSTAQLKQALYTNLEFLDPDSLQFEHIDVENMNVLVVDDSRFARRQIIRTLTSMGMEKIHRG